jgi:hypothetical protein
MGGLYSRERLGKLMKGHSGPVFADMHKLLLSRQRKENTHQQWRAHRSICSLKGALPLYFILLMPFVRPLVSDGRVLTDESAKDFRRKCVYPAGGTTIKRVFSPQHLSFFFRLKSYVCSHV